MPALPRPTSPIAITLAAALLLASCATAPVPPPPVAAPARFKEDAVWKHAVGAAAEPVPPDWWRLFDDPVLDGLQRQLAIGNENLKAAVAQVAGARAALQASQAALLPTLSVNGAASRSGGPQAAAGTRGTTASLGLDASWEVDLWGRLSQGVTAAGASYQASRDDLAAARLSAQATLVQSYLALRAAEAQQALLERTAAADRRSLELTQARHAAGVADGSDVLQAQTQLLGVQAQIEDAGLQRAQLEHAIAVLIGQAPSAFTLARSASLPLLPTVPEFLPSTLLEQRPDIAAAERRVAAAYAQIGVADAAFFPSVTLSASAGFRGTALAGLLSAPHSLWSLGPALAAAILDGGARRQASEQARAAAEQAGSSYRQTVLTALQEVEDNLAALERIGAELTLQQAALQAAQRNQQIVQDQYQAGTVSYLNVASAQTATLTAEASVLSLRNRRLAAANVLLKNIGGKGPPFHP
ncbi:efflux transporter outer membrane subunit [Piscinibacter sp. XHJ-5]|uniref:efflux transporter outer membrane subunit n=1 Tax=Piscinibacter sp. XHJ-5 TaxID=3037797 RepID=UPI002452E4C7|nr:efflux transporter outer membrane subunit [Piscinibacter sp. XHJ-5]